MTAKQADVSVIGERNEQAAALLLGRVASVVRVQRQEDYGIDFYCQPIKTHENRAQVVGGHFAVQVKGASADFTIGGLRPRKAPKDGEKGNAGEWKDYEVAWYRQVSGPLFLGVVRDDGDVLDLYSLVSTLCPFWKTKRLPFSIAVSAETDIGQESSFAEPSDPTTTHDGLGDGKEWICSLGTPFLRLTREAVKDAQHVEAARAQVRTWVAVDRMNWIFLGLGIGQVQAISPWRTNDFVCAARRMKVWRYWSTRPDAIVGDLARVLAPVATLFALNLKTGGGDLPNLAPLLQWLKDRDMLDEQGLQLLENWGTDRIR